MLQPAQSDAGFGGAQARQLGGLAEAGLRAQTVYDNEQAKIKYRDDVAKADAAYVQLQTEYTKASIGWKSEYVGANADGVTAAADKWWADAQTRYNDGLDDQQRALLAQHASRLRVNSVGDVLSFQEHEKKKFSTQAASAFISNKIGEAAQNPELNVATSRQLIKDKLIEQKVLHKWNDDMLTAETKRWLTNMHGEVVETMLSNGKPDEARRYLSQAVNLGDVSGTSIDDFNQRIDRGVEQLAVRKTQQHRQDVANLRGKVELDYEKTGRLPLSITALEELDPGAAADVRKAVRNDQKARAKEARGENIVTDIGALFEARDKIIGEEPVNLLGYRDRVSRSDLEELKKLQERVANPANKKRLFSEERTVDGYRPKEMKSTSPNWLNLRRKLEQTLVNERDSRGRDLSEKEMREVLDNQFVKGVIERPYWFDSTLPRVKMTPEEEAVAKFPPAAVPRVKSPGEARKLPKGTRFIDPNGVERIR